MSINGDLRFEGDSGRILLEHDDSAFQPLRDLHVAGGHVAFTLARGGRHFDGTITDTLMWGTGRDDHGAVWTWRALPLPAGSRRWPVPPRLTVRQLLLGNTTPRDTIPGRWLAALPPTSTIEAEVAAGERAAALPPIPARRRNARATQLMLGLGPFGREAEAGIIDHIAASPAGDAVFRSLFQTSRGRRTDIFDVLSGEAAHYVSYGFELSAAARGLVAIGALAQPFDTAAVRYAIWQLWAHMAGDTAALVRQLTPLEKTDAMAAGSVRAAVAGFDDAVEWWQRAVHWLLTRTWLRTPDGWRSPVQLMARFWGVDSLPLPAIRPAHFGSADANPVIGVAHIARYLVRADNASAAEWLTEGGGRDALAAWLPLHWGELPLTVSIAGHDEVVMSPGAEADSHPAGFFGDSDAIRIDPAITPLAAIPVILHEWTHLIVAQRRLTGPRPLGLSATVTEVRLRHDDPWLAEGLAEWAADEMLQPAGTDGAWLRLTQAEKRLAIAGRDSLDPHVLGYRMVRAAAARLGPVRTRDRLVAALDNARRAAANLGFAGGAGRAPLLLDLPVTSAVLPEVTFTWDDGVVFGMSRRLVVPDTPQEF
ncbi:MAG: hypothetical protein ACREL5_02325 [Gemmatimonadales bacterium]